MSGEPDRRKHNILVVEDNSADVKLLRLALEQAGLDCELTVIEDGGEAYRYVQEHGRSGRQTPDLTILDLNIPKNDGLEILEAMRKSAAFTEVPVVILTSSSSPRERAKVEALGVARHVTKPMDFEEFMGIGTIVKEILYAHRIP